MTGTAAWPEVMPALGRWFPQPSLAAAGLLALALVFAGALWAMLDGRLVGGEPVALKPTRFALGIGVHMLTACWVLGYARPERLSSALVRGTVWVLLAGAGVELACVILQAARGRRSHLNLSTPVDAAISATMGAMAVLFMSANLPLAWEIARRPRPDAPPLMVWAIVASLVASFVLGTLTGLGMGKVVAGAVIPDIVRLPLLGTIRGGSPRIAHFLGVHAMQALPLMAAGTLMLQGRTGAIMLAAGALCYVGATLVLLSRPSLRESRPALAAMPERAAVAQP